MTHLSLEKRYQISACLGANISVKEIAQQIGVHISTIYREIHRGSDRRGKYSAENSHKAAVRRIRRANTRNAIRISQGIVDRALKLVEKFKFSPVQASEFIRLTAGSPMISHETIYRAIGKDQKNGGTVWKSLRRRRKKYCRRLGKTAGRGLIRNPRDISTRPAAVENRSRYGDWEADTVVGSKTRGKVIVTLVERRSRCLLAGFADSRSAQDVSDVIINLLKDLPQGMRRTITYDNGKEFAFHQKIDKALGTTGYFARPYHSWERGSNENTNGLLRQFFPKGEPFENRTDTELSEAQSLINLRPRKLFNFQSAGDIFCRKVKSLRSAEIRADKVFAFRY